MPKERGAVTLTTMPDGLVQFRSFDERIHGQILEHAWQIACAEKIEGFEPKQEDYRLHITAPLEIEGRPDAVLEARLQIPKEDYNAFRKPALQKDEESQTSEPQEPGALDVFLQDDEEDINEEVDSLRELFEKRRQRNALAHQQRMEIVKKAANWLTDTQFIGKLLESYGHKPFKQREGVALTARDIGQWITVRDEDAENPRWGFFMPHTGHSSHQGDDSWYFTRHVSPITGEQIESDKPEFQDKVTEDLDFVAQAIKKVVASYNSEMEERGYYLPDYRTVPRIGLTSYKDFYEGYTEFAPQGHTLLSASLEEAYYGVLAEDYRIGNVSVQAVFKDSEKAQPLVEGFFLPYGSTESTFLVYSADTSGKPTVSGIREHSFKGMYGKCKQSVGFAPANFYATVQFLHDLAKTVPSDK